MRKLKKIACFALPLLIATGMSGCAKKTTMRGKPKGNKMPCPIKDCSIETLKDLNFG